MWDNVPPMAASLQPAKERGLMAVKRAERKRKREKEEHKVVEKKRDVELLMPQLIWMIASCASGLITPPSHL